MLLAAVLISVAVVDPQLPDQSAPPAAPKAQEADTSRPYTVAGVRRAMSGDMRPIDYNSTNRDQVSHRLVVDSRSPARGTWSQSVSDWQDSYRYGSTQTWHNDYLVMAGPRRVDVPCSGMCAAGAVGIAVVSVPINKVLGGLSSYISHKIAKAKADRKQRKIDKIRAEIRAELEELERVNAAARAAGRLPVK